MFKILMSGVFALLAVGVAVLLLKTIVECWMEREWWFVVVLLLMAVAWCAILLLLVVSFHDAWVNA